MLKVFFRFQSAAGQERISDADRGGALKRRADVKGIIPLQETPVNVVEDIVLMVSPVFPRKLGGDLLQLFCQSLLPRGVKTPL